MTIADGTLNLNGASARVDGAISGQAGSTVNVNDGFTTEGSIALGTLAVSSDGVLTLNNDITALGAFTNAGEVKIASGITRNLTSDYTQAAGGLRAICAGSTTSYSRLIASGTVDFTTGNTLDVDIADVSAFAIDDLLCGVVQGVTINGRRLHRDRPMRAAHLYRGRKWQSGRSGDRPGEHCRDRRCHLRRPGGC
ncbi:MAG: hypothetical protein ACR2Q4_23710 [Geminicoccaceae bacterium]